MFSEIKGRLINSIIAATTIILLAAFKWSIIDIITPFLFLPLAGVVGLFFIIIAIASLTCIMKYKKIGLVSFTPLAIIVSGFMTVYFVPFTELWVKANFALYKNEREDIVKKVYENELKPNVSYSSSLIRLDNSYPSVSSGGNEILVEEHSGRKYVFFFTFRGVLDNYSGFVYVPNGGNPRDFSDLNESPATQIKFIGGNWYYGAHH